MRTFSTVARFLFVALAMLSGGCGHRVGDSCQQNVDCSPLGDRFCDLASTNGYCTVEGCDVRMDKDGNSMDSCPSEAVCVRFFSPISSKPCDHPNAACDPNKNTLCCLVSERCLCQTSDPANPGRCLEKTQSYCAPESSERRWCLLQCNSDKDCRASDGYTCRAPGTNGAELVPGEPDKTLKFCVQKGQ